MLLFYVLYYSLQEGIGRGILDRNVKMIKLILQIGCTVNENAQGLSSACNSWKDKNDFDVNALMLPMG